MGAPAPARMTRPDLQKLKEAWDTDGWCVAESVVPADLLAAVQAAMGRFFPSAEEFASDADPERNRPLYDLVVGSCREAGFEPVLGKEFTTAQDSLATLGLGRPHWTVFYRAHANLLPMPGVAFRPLRDPTPVMPTYLATHAERHVSPALLALIEAARATA